MWLTSNVIADLDPNTFPIMVSGTRNLKLEISYSEVDVEIAIGLHFEEEVDEGYEEEEAVAGMKDVVAVEERVFDDDDADADADADVDVEKEVVSVESESLLAPPLCA